jgi:hypothetical protein
MRLRIEPGAWLRQNFPDMQSTDFPSGGPLDEKGWLPRLVQHTAAPGRHAARNALAHLERAAVIQDLDPLMAWFRAITAEEEAARAVFSALQRRRYLGARRLKWTQHTHKAALWPFFIAVQEVLRRYPFECYVRVKLDAKVPLLRTGIRLSLNGQKYNAEPDPPLNFSISEPGVLQDFAAEIGRLVTTQRVATVEQLVRRRANERNTLLYANERGIPEFQGDLRAYLERARSRVRVMLAVFLFIDPYAEHQPFVQQALWAFVALLDEVERRRETRRDQHAEGSEVDQPSTGRDI